MDNGYHLSILQTEFTLANFLIPLFLSSVIANEMKLKSYLERRDE